jgi:hypothetical protein
MVPDYKERHFTVTFHATFAKDVYKRVRVKISSITPEFVDKVAFELIKGGSQQRLAF